MLAGLKKTGFKKLGGPEIFNVCLAASAIAAGFDGIGADFFVHVEFAAVSCSGFLLVTFEGGGDFASVGLVVVVVGQYII